MAKAHGMRGFAAPTRRKCEEKERARYSTVIVIVWSMVRAKVFREALVMYWWKVTVENGCAEDGHIRKRDRKEFEREMARVIM